MRFLVIAEWDLVSSGATIDDLREWVQSSAAEKYRSLSGVIVKTWYSNPHLNTWGAVYLVNDPHALDADRLPRGMDGKTGPVGAPPSRVSWHQVEMHVEGPEYPARFADD